MFITALFIIAKIWEQCVYPSMHKWIKKSCVYICRQWMGKMSATQNGLDRGALHPLFTPSSVSTTKREASFILFGDKKTRMRTFLLGSLLLLKCMTWSRTDNHIFNIQAAISKSIPRESSVCITYFVWHSLLSWLGLAVSVTPFIQWGISSAVKPSLVPGVQGVPCRGQGQKDFDFDKQVLENHII